MGETELTFPDGTKEKRVIWLDKKPNIKPVSYLGVTGDPISLIYSEVKPEKRIIFGEKRLKGHSPYVFESATDKDAKSGDKTIKIVFRYTDGIKWYSTQQDVTIHINNWLEENQFRPIVILVILTAFVGIVNEFNKWLFEGLFILLKILTYLIEAVALIASMDIFLELEIIGRFNYLLVLLSIILLILIIVFKYMTKNEEPTEKE